MRLTHVSPSFALHDLADCFALDIQAVRDGLVRFTLCGASSNTSNDLLGEHRGVMRFAFRHYAPYALARTKADAATPRLVFVGAAARLASLDWFGLQSRRVHPWVSAAIRQLQVLRAIVRFVVIAMMDQFAVKQRTAQRLRHDQTMLKDVSVLQSIWMSLRRFYKSITAPRSRLSAVPSIVPRTARLMTVQEDFGLSPSLHAPNHGSRDCELRPTTTRALEQHEEIVCDS